MTIDQMMRRAAAQLLRFDSNGNASKIPCRLLASIRYKSEVSSPVQQERLSKILSSPSSNLTLSRREAERLIRAGDVSIAGQIVKAPQVLVSYNDLIGSLKVQGKLVQLDHPREAVTHQAKNETRVWLAHKVSGEIVADSDPHNRPSLLQRLSRGGVGKLKNGSRLHLKSVGRLDYMSEGLILVTNDGQYAREMELPSSQIHRSYRVRVHGLLTDQKLSRIRQGVTVDGVWYAPMRVEIEAKSRFRGSTNKWVKVTCCEGKNRQIRKIFKYLGLDVSKLIRVAYGDYQLDTIPPGMAIEVPVKPVERQQQKGLLFPKRKVVQPREESRAPLVQWIHRH